MRMFPFSRNNDAIFTHHSKHPTAAPMVARAVRGWTCGLMFASGLLLAAPEKQEVDVAHSTLDFMVASSLVDVEGTFKQWKGEVLLDREDVTKSSISIQIDASSIDTRIEKRDNHLRSPDFFDVAKFPSITFKSSKVVKTGEKTMELVGDLTIHGRTKSVSIPITIDRLQDNYSRFKGEVTINRQDFGINYQSSINAIEDNVKVRLVINVRKPEK